MRAILVVSRTTALALNERTDRKVAEASAHCLLLIAYCVLRLLFAIALGLDLVRLGSGLRSRNSLNVRRSRTNQFQPWRFRQCGQNLASDVIVDLCGIVEFDGITDHNLKACLRESEAAHRFWSCGAHIEQVLHLAMFLLDALTVSGVNLFDGAENSRFCQLEVAVRSKRERDLVPDKVCAWRLFVEARSRLKDDGIGEHDDAAGRLNVITTSSHLHEVQANQSNV